jgi:hypothetical protein
MFSGRHPWQRWKIPPAQDEAHSLTCGDGFRHGKLVHADRNAADRPGETPVKGALRAEAPTTSPLATGGVNT